MTPQELKNSILQLAIQGKLVEQRAEEGTGKELLEKILAAKNAEGAKKNLTQRRRDAEATKESRLVSNVSRPVEDSPFDVPESWEWVRLKEITTKITDGTHHSPPNQETGDFMYVTAKNIKDEGVIVSNITYVSADVHAEIFARCNPELGDILLIKDGATTGVVTVNNIDRPFSLLSSVALLKLPENICAWYLVYALRSDLFYKLLRKQMKGTGITRITLKQIEPLLIPLPPLAEQKRIVAKIEELMPLVDRYEKAWSKLKDFNKRFPADMQKSLLQMAIQGKLVEQRAEEGTGEELYRQIQVERERLIKNGAVKVEKPFDPISDDEKPFEIPENWTWVRFGNLGSYKKGPFGSALTKSIFVTKGADSVKVYEQKNAIQKDATLGEYYIRRDYFETKMSGFEVHSGDVIVSCAGTIGETYVLPEGIEQGIINQALMRMKIFVPMYVPYFLMFFDVVLKQSARANSKGSAIKNIPPFEILKNYLVPLPPLAEQKRIVAKLEELLPLCERLK